MSIKIIDKTKNKLGGKEHQDVLERAQRTVGGGKAILLQKVGFGAGRLGMLLAVLMLVGGLLAPGSAYAAKGKTLAEEEEQPKH